MRRNKTAAAYLKDTNGVIGYRSGDIGYAIAPNTLVLSGT